MNSFPIEKIIASLEGQLSSEEQTALEDWLSESEENRNQYNELRKVVRMGNSVKAGFQPDEYRALQKVNRRIQIKRIVRRTQLSAAAVFLTFFIAKAILSVVPDVNWKEVTATNRQVIYLSDSTKVVLAEHANFKYPEKFNGDERVVFLRGQAYFEVTFDAKQPFKVSMPNTTIMVLGTTFFADADKPEKESVLVDQGKVFFYTKNFDSDKSVIVKADEVGEWNSVRNEIINRKNIDPNSYSELSGRLVFRNATLVDVAKDLEKFYSVKIQLEGNYSSQIQFSGIFSLDDGIDKVLKLITLTAPLTIEKSGNTYLLKLRDKNVGVWADPQIYQK
ncbi:MAG: FecR domain-containing protein [Prolixibacteraceae bacterium]|jgi:ferric-dicitrate binding protein FerR (iron transport regulator)